MTTVINLMRDWCHIFDSCHQSHCSQKW